MIKNYFIQIKKYFLNCIFDSPGFPLGNNRNRYVHKWYYTVSGLYMRAHLYFWCIINWFSGRKTIFFHDHYKLSCETTVYSFKHLMAIYEQMCKSIQYSNLESSIIIIIMKHWNIQNWSPINLDLTWSIPCLTHVVKQCWY